MSITEFECCCCFSDIDLNNALSCKKGHVFFIFYLFFQVTCAECLERALGIAVGDQTLIKCFHESQCKEYYPEAALRKATDNIKLRKAYDNVVINYLLIDLNEMKINFRYSQIIQYITLNL